MISGCSSPTGNTATGYFLTNDANTATDSFSITVSGPATGSDFTANVSVGYSLSGGTITSPTIPVFPRISPYSQPSHCQLAVGSTPSRVPTYTPTVRAATIVRAVE